MFQQWLNLGTCGKTQKFRSQLWADHVQTARCYTLIGITGNSVCVPAFIIDNCISLFLPFRSANFSDGRRRKNVSNPISIIKGDPKTGDGICPNTTYNIDVNQILITFCMRFRCGVLCDQALRKVILYWVLTKHKRPLRKWKTLPVTCPVIVHKRGMLLMQCCIQWYFNVTYSGIHINFTLLYMANHPTIWVPIFWPKCAINSTYKLHTLALISEI